MSNATHFPLYFRLKEMHCLLGNALHCSPFLLCWRITNIRKKTTDEDFSVVLRFSNFNHFTQKNYHNRRSTRMMMDNNRMMNDTMMDNNYYIHSCNLLRCRMGYYTHNCNLLHQMGLEHSTNHKNSSSRHKLIKSVKMVDYVVFSG